MLETTFDTPDGVLACAEAIALGYRIRRRMQAGEFYADICEAESVSKATGLMAMRLSRADERGRLRGATPGQPCHIDEARRRVQGDRDRVRGMVAGAASGGGAW